VPTASACLKTTAASVTSDRLHCVVGAFGAMQLVAAPQQVFLDLQARTLTVTGHLSQDHATAVIPLPNAARLFAELAAAVTQAESLPSPSVAPAWSDAAVHRIALPSPARRHPNRKCAA
jgi:hypothetical protein